MLKLDAPVNTDDQGLNRVLASELPTLLFLTTGSPDPALQTVLNEIARADAGRLLVARLNILENPSAAKRFHTRGVPLLITFKGGEERLRLEMPTPGQVRAASAHLLGRGPAPQQATRADSTKQGDAQPIIVTEATFDVEVLRSAEPVLVDFWAPWCGPCRMIAPILESFAREYAGRLRIAKLNIDENPTLAARYHAYSIPLLVLFKNGEAIQQLLGAHPEANLRRFVEQALQ